MTLYEDRSRGRVTLKLDPSNSPVPSTTNTPKTSSPANSPMMQFLQPRTSTPIRISPPNSPESIIQQQQQSKKSNEDKSNKGLVMAI
jgi:protein Tob/BTG